MTPTDLRALRERFRLSQRDLASLVGRSQPWVAALESGRRPITPWAAAALQGAVEKLHRQERETLNRVIKPITNLSASQGRK